MNYNESIDELWTCAVTEMVNLDSFVSIIFCTV